MPPKKIRCTFHDCKQTAQRIVGDCGFCNGHYCGDHRLLEDHKCSGLEDVSPMLPAPACSASTKRWKVSKNRPRAFRDRNIQWWLVGLSPDLLADMST